MQEAADSLQTSGESCSPKAPAEYGRGLDGPSLSSEKPKKRELPDHSTTAGKRIQRMEECTSPKLRECPVDLVDDVGGLVSTASVDQLLSKMKQGMPSSLQRSAVAKTLVATSKGDFLKKFVSLGGVPTLEEWIQEGVKIRSTDSAVKESDKALDEEIMVILQALEKLPISLETLKGCSIGKSVKQLRNVRNGEIQKKAKKLVDTWRKRVDLEIKQSCAPPVAISDRQQQVDAAPHRSDHSLSKVTEVHNRVTVKAGGATHLQEDNNLLKAQILQSTSANGAALDGSPRENTKNSAEDTIKNVARPSISYFASVTGLSPSKKQKILAPLSADQDCKDEASNLPDYQNLREKDSKGDVSSNHTATDIAARKTNEYRKKLRSGGSSASLCSVEPNATGLPGNAAHIRDHNSEKLLCMDGNVGDSEHQHTELHNGCPNIESAGLQGADEEFDPPGISDMDCGYKDGNQSYLHVQDGKIEHTNGSCLSSQSSCSNKRNIGCPNGLTVENTSLSTSPLQGNTKLYPVANRLSEQANDSYSGKGALQSRSSENHHSDVYTHKLAPEAESNHLSESVRNVLCEQNGSANVTHGVEVGASDREESCCSHTTRMYRKVGSVAVTAPDRDQNVAEQIAAKHSPAQYSVHEVVGALDGAACFESTKLVSNSCQEPANESAKSTKAPLLTDVNLETDEIDKAHKVPSEIPAFTQSCHDFDLNEGLAMEEFGHEIQPSCGSPSSTSCVVPKVAGTLSAPIAVSIAAKGAFIPSLNAPCKSDIGWRGSAATSAFRPAEPRHTSAKMQPSAISAITEARNVNSFDLNASDHECFEDPSALPCQDLQEAHLDLNYGGKPGSSVSDFSTRVQFGSAGTCGEKRAVLDFDLNEEVNEAQEQVILPTFAAKTLDCSNPYGGLIGTGAGRDYSLWNSPDGTFKSASASVIGPKIEVFSPGSTNQPVISSRQLTPTTFVPPPSSSFVFSQAAPFFGGSQQTSFPAGFTYNPISAGPDTSFIVSRGFPETTYMVSKGLPGTVGFPMSVRSRAETSVRPAFLPNIDDLRGGNNFIAWGRSPQNIYGNSGATVISYNDLSVGGRDHTVNVDGNAILEEQMRSYQQAVVPVSPFPVSSLKRRDPEYFPGLKQTTWN